jgi:hypothetical protein
MGHYPSAEEFVEFVVNRLVVCGERPALMQDIRQCIDQICAQFAIATRGVPPAVFAWRFKRSAAVQTRIRMERSPPQHPPT